MTEYRGTALEIDLTDGHAARTPINSAEMHAFLGGRGLNVALLWSERHLASRPLAPEAPIYLAAGPFVGSSIPGGARFNITARSPQTGILGDANAGGHFAAELRFAGLDQLRLRGRSPHPTYLFIDGSDVEVRDARPLWGLDIVEASQSIQEEIGDPGIHVAAVGPAAENGVRFAGLFADGARAAARTGMGTVLASKRLKAIAVRGDRRPPPADPQRLRSWAREINERLRAHPEYETRHRLGSTQLIAKLQAIGALPTRHFQSGTFAAAAAVSGEAIERTYKLANDGCFACPVRCSRRIQVDDPRFSQFTMEGPEYEPLAGFTARVGVADLPLALHAVDRCNRLGLDAITTSEVIAWAMELTQRGLLTPDEAGGFDLRFGSGQTVLDLIEAIAVREGFGDLLADGVRAAADRLGRGAELAMHVKGLELFQADVRAMKGYALGNAVSSRGADHLRSEPWFEFSGDAAAAVERYGDAGAADRLAWTGKGRLVAHFEEMAAVCDAVGMCKNLYNNMGVLDWDETAEVLSAIVGGPWSGEEVQRAGARIVNLERILNATWGVDRREDTLPARFLHEPAGPEDSPSSGTVVELEPMLDEYFDVRGWDPKTGLPTDETLRALGLEASRG